MIFSTLFNLLLISVFAGYSFAFKKYFLKEEKIISNLDLLYGLFFLISFSLIANFFFALKYFSFLIIIFGLIFFITGLKKKQIEINFFYHFIILFFLTVIIYQNGDNVDSPMYHLQIIKWLLNEKIAFGLSNLEIRFGSSSLWFNLIAILKIKLNNFTNIYTFNLIPFSILIYQISEKKNQLSYLFLLLSISFIFLFSFLHPFANGVILNHLHNTELDTVGMIFYILSFFLFLKFFEDEKIETLRLLILSCSISILIKISYIGISIFLLFSLFNFYRLRLNLIFKDKIFKFLLFIVLLWFIKNLIISGCLIFPITFTCLTLDWAPNINEIDFHAKEIKGYARDTTDRLRYTDFNHTIYSLDWFKPWFKDYAINTAFLQISFIVVFVSFIFLITSNFLSLLDNKFKKKIKFYLIVFILFLPNFYIWFQAPEIRFGWGTIISFSCFLVASLLYHLKLLKNFNLRFYQSITILILAILIYDNKNNLSFYNLKTPYIKNTDYSKIFKFREINGFQIYKSSNWRCYDFEEICINSEKEKYKIEKKLGYFHIQSNFK